MPLMQFNDKKFSLEKKKQVKKKRSLINKIFSHIALFAAICAALLAVFLALFLKDISQSLPTTEEILGHEPSLATIVYDRNEKVITRLFQENRNWVKLDVVSPWMVKAILAAEDDRFYDHSGIRPVSIFRAGIVDIFHRGARQGGSTITQQLARNLFLTKEKTIIRKAKEAILALRLERIYTKDQLLEMYLNTIYMGHGAYGIDSASKNYFGKAPGQLSITESAVLAGLVAAPETYSPFRNPSRSKTRKDYVLKRMLDLDWISKSDFDTSVNDVPKLVKREANKSSIFLKDSPHFVSYILFNRLLPNYGTEMVYRGGLRVHTTIDLDLQKKAEELVSKMKHEGALVALDPNTGEILALVGGRDFDASKFNRATQAFRQPGSAFKPIVYATALENGYRAVDHLLDAPLIFPNGWEPGNYGSKYDGEVTLMDALARSINTVAIRLAQIDGVSRVVEMARRMGISTPHLPEDLSLALGTASVTPLEMCVAYSTFANNGYKVEPYGIKEIKGKNGESIEQNGPKLANAISVTTAVTARSMLEQVAVWGTGAKARIDGHQTFGKTGTTNDWTDAWFAGGIPGLVVVVYVGNDDHTPLGGKTTGTVAAVPVWKEFVSFAVKKLKLPSTFILPPDAGVESVRVCKKTGFLAADGCPATNILLPAGHAPSSQCPWHGGSLSAARADDNAPQLILAPIDDEMTHYKYAMRGLPQPEEPVDVSTVPEPEPALSVKKTVDKEHAKVPDKNSDPYKKDPSEPVDMEAKYQELLKRYNIIE
ncbi:MAG: PBP1A family penicillin-binding protein [Synergistaceae bacterium]|nr:PBP1A family penicillin-binding protein [Synergistaceae bacterium]MDD2350620.1 PBP1A family penicillin-binding protein [Synergistaceae bacterium]MDD3319633.1 PBP1A family penicillin-binding protein [Synergistaceae bacterium]MDD3963826.1 PBP1A family penicillin-binding protein [Synergistaceae bacterium]